MHILTVAKGGLQETEKNCILNKMFINKANVHIIQTTLNGMLIIEPYYNRTEYISRNIRLKVK